MSTIVVYLLMGFIQLRTGTRSTARYPGPVRSVWYIAFWLPIELSTIAATAWSELQLQYENAVLCALFDSSTLKLEELKSAVVTRLCGEELGALGWYCVLKHMTRKGLLFKSGAWARPDVWYTITESGIREVIKRGLE